MPKGTAYLFIVLSALAFFLIGFNAGKILGPKNESITILPSPTPFPPTPTPSLLPTLPLKESTSSGQVQGTSTYTNRSCGFSFSYPGSYLNQKSVNNQSIILTDPNNPNLAIATTCAARLPKPSIGPENIEIITLGGETATLYHDKDEEGNPREDVFVTHPETGMEIIIAGFGAAFQSALSTFKFIR
ncbi:hypothetical protein HYW55_00405 [Candidatus Gottesmanbacteria bacterium]|nr:hypothetical protein [Candidatus Gottesmanbacteria bacterium]